MVAKVLWRDAQGIEGEIDLGAGEVRVGRAVDCAIRTDDAMVSRHHARLMWNGGGYLLEDLGSANGIFFQEQRVQSHLLKHGDAVRCGSLWLRYVDTAQLVGVAAPAAAFTPAPPAGGSYPSSAGPVVASPMGGQPVTGAEPLSTGPAPAPPSPVPTALSSGEADEEIRRLRRRIEQMQAELRVYRGGKHGADAARKMEDLENDMASMQAELDLLRTRVKELEELQLREGGSVKVQRAIEIRGKATEIVTSLNDVLSSLRIEVMAAEGEFDQYSHAIPRASFELIRQSMKEAATSVDSARDLLRQLRDVTG